MMTPHPAWNTLTRPALTLAALALILTLAAPRARAGGSPEAALLVVDPANAESMYVANVYRTRRDIPQANLIFLTPGATDFASLAALQLETLLGELEGRGNLDGIDYVVIPPGSSFFVAASGLLSDGCGGFGLHRFALPNAYGLVFQKDAILAGGLSSSLGNEYARNTYGPRAFDGATSWLDGFPSEAPGSRRYWIGAMLGYTGERGNTLQEVLDLIERSASVDGSHPLGSVYFMQTTDAARSTPRHGAFPAAVSAITAAGGQAQHLMANLPSGQHDAMGIMTGLASPAIDTGDFSLLPGSFADHLTSFAGRFDTSSQVKMSRWIAKGASASAGTVEEPCAFAGKFPHARLHGLYLKGLSLGEAWHRSVNWTPFQLLFLGDPLTRPYADFPSVDLPDPGLLSGSVDLLATASASAPGAAIEELELYVDGIPSARASGVASLPLDTLELADGWHELRVLARDDTSPAHVGRFVRGVFVDNLGRSVALSGSSTSGDLGTRFDFTLQSAGTPDGDVRELRLFSNGRVVAAAAGSSAVLSVHGRNLGAGPLRVQAEALYVDGGRARSAPLDLDVTFAPGTPQAAPPVAYGMLRRVRDDVPFLLELPASFAEDHGSATFDLLQAPAQASLLGGSGPWRSFRPDPSASGCDTLVFRVSTPAGVSADATISLEYTPACAPPVPYCSSAPHSAGAGARIGSSGSASVSSNDLVLEVLDAPPMRFGLFYYGPNAIQAPFGDGFRCVGGTTFRLNPPLATDGAGGVARPLDLTQPPEPAGQIDPGATWNFQFWFRDPGGPGGSGFNLSDGLSATFCP